MSKKVSVSEARKSLSSILQWIVDSSEVVTVESRGKPKVAILSYTEYQEFLAFREQARRKEALRQLQELMERMWARNADLTPDEVEQLADEISRETIQRMIDEGKIFFQY
jgi:prevent-host-death family protein